MPQITKRSFVEKMRASGAKVADRKPTEPLWKGPQVDGITFSLLSRFLVCRERFRLLVVDGLRPVEDFNQRIEYGNMWHRCEEIYANAMDRKHNDGTPAWKAGLREYCQQLAKQYPLQGKQVEHWYNICALQFPLYIGYWKKQPDVKQRTPLMQEQVFNVPYTLPSGRVVRLRGKFDSVDIIGKGNDAGVYLQENKTKGDINEALMQRQLMFDLQTMIYLVALEQVAKEVQKNPIKGVRYNVIRRPLSSGRHSIKQHKPTKKQPKGESLANFYKRLEGLIRSEPEFFFMRWKVEMLPTDVARFKRECLNPILEQLCDWWEHIQNCAASDNHPFHVSKSATDPKGVHFRFPYGTYNPMLEGKASEMDEYLASGSTLGLHRAETLFRELTP